MFVKGIRPTLRKRYEKHRPVAFFRAVPLLSENRFLARRQGFSMRCILSEDGRGSGKSCKLF